MVPNATNEYYIGYKDGYITISSDKEDSSVDNNKDKKKVMTVAISVTVAVVVVVVAVVVAVVAFLKCKSSRYEGDSSQDLAI